MANEIQWGGGNFATNQGGSIGTIKNTVTSIVEPWNMGCGRDSGKTGTKLDSQGNEVIYDVTAFEPAVTRVDGGYAFNNEPQAENLFLFSEDFTGSGWTSQRATVTKDSSNPYVQVGKNSTKWQLTNETGAKYLRVGDTRTGNYHFSIYVKKGNYRYLGILNTNSNKTVIDFDTKSIVIGTSYSELEELNNGWFRISLISTWSGTFSYTGVYYTDETGDELTVSPGGEFFYIDAAQLEIDHLTSYIPTNGATATRLADTGYTSPDLSKWINGSNFKLELEFYFDYQYTSNRRFTFSNGTDSNRLRVTSNANSNSLSVNFDINGSSSLVVFGGTFVNGLNKIEIEARSGYYETKLNNISLGVDNETINFNENEIKFIALSEVNDTINTFFNIKGIKITS